MTWIISLPAWGDYHIYTLLKFTLPAIEFALKHAQVKGRIVIHTDDPRVSLTKLAGCSVELRPVNHGETHHDTYGDCHRDVIRSAEPGECVSLLNADIVVSREAFRACEGRFAAGKKIVIAAATRCLFKEGVVPPLGARARDLLAWTMLVKHPSVAQCFWGTGRSMIPWAIYFQTPTGIVVRGFHLHPLAFLKRKDLPPFRGTSLDEHLVEEFSEEETHVVTSPDELALAELSPPDRLFKLLEGPLSEKAVFAWAQHRATERHRWLFTHRIVVAGTGEDQSDVEPCNFILEKLRYSRSAFNGPLPAHFTQLSFRE